MRTQGWVLVAASVLLSGCEPAATPAPDSVAPPDASQPSTSPAAPAPGAEMRASILRFRCGDDLDVTAAFHPPDAVDLDVAGRSLTLARAPAASGTRYTDAAGNEFW